MKKLTTVLIAFAVIAFLVGNSLFIVNEGEQAVVTRFGRVLPANYVKAGLKFKIPFIDTEHKYPKKLLSWDGQADLLPTSDDKRILLDTTARWRIADPKVFYAKLADITDAFNKLDDIIDKRVRAVIGRYPMVEIVRTDNEMITITAKKKSKKAEEDILGTPSDDAGGSAVYVELINSSTSNVSRIIEVSQGRLALEQEILEYSRQEINPKSLGIELVDVLIRQVQYPDNVAAKAFERMASERKKRAAEQRSRGEGQKAYWLGRLEKEQQTIIAQAESKAAAIYREAYDKDPEFYRFWRAMDSYGETLAGIDKVLSTDMAYFDYLYNSRGNR
ncbi:protease modulator HflC [Candidatus Haliotispira prima]|uniref:Protein HflC n=1 Tax=Candidatus Haliotispira prima TaxID=3034016 RepID=A0ABY8MM69_9SPIO|nr:protease modulator HflC [Candidatus Haliotispira prima]